MGSHVCDAHTTPQNGEEEREKEGTRLQPSSSVQAVELMAEVLWPFGTISKPKYF